MASSPVPRIVAVTETTADFTESAGYALQKLCEQAGLPFSSILFVSIIPKEARLADFTSASKSDAVEGYPPYIKGLWWSDAEWMRELHRQILAPQPYLILALGAAPLWLTTRKTGLKKWRGSPMPGLKDTKVLATYSPSALLRQWDLRPVIYMDLIKAAKESQSPFLKRPHRKLILAPTIEDIEAFIRDHINPAPFIAADIETKAGQITEIGFASSRSRGIIIPFWSRLTGNYWPSLEAELHVWSLVRDVLTRKKIIGQNFSYDMQYLYRIYGVKSPGFAGDTMLLHHSLQPELEKGLGFLGSIYTDEPSWKFMRTDHATMKREDE